MRRTCLALGLTIIAVLAACGQPPPAEPDAGAAANGGAATLAASEPSRVAAAAVEVPLLAVGDIGMCDNPNDNKVARFVRSRSARVATLGDTVYESGSHQEFAECWEPHWGSIKDRIYPAVGNHEYKTPGADGYFDYFGARAGKPTQGWYSYDLGPHWRAIVLNSQCWEVGGCSADSPQGRWLTRTLNEAGDRNVLAYFHAPRYSTGEHGSNLAMKPMFRALYLARADIVLSGHDHDYERFAPQNASGDRRVHGVQQFVVGTGGRGLYPWGRSRLPNTQARNNTTHGVLRLVLRANGYSWRFIPVVGTYTDSGSRSLN
jgi:acid phosphatase type 7